MNTVLLIGMFFVGLAAGFAIASLFVFREKRTVRQLSDELYRENEEKHKSEQQEIFENMKAHFGNISNESLQQSINHFFKIAEEKFSSERTTHAKELETKKLLIDEQLVKMTSELSGVSKLVGDFEKDREKKFGELTKHLEETGRRTSELITTTNSLKEALADSKTRGQWGERMAEDVLRLAGFVENINYIKQKAVEGSQDIPDFTFFLPRGLFVNMDVKFPYDNYVKYLEAESDIEKQNYLKLFLRDIRNKIKEVVTRDYINPEQNTVDYVLMFIPNEQIYSFIYEHDSALLDESLGKRVIMCSPLTLFAVLGVIRAAVENFALEQKSNEMLSLFGTFAKQWKKFLDSLEIVSKRFESTQKEFTSLLTTRRNQLDKPLHKIEEIRKSRDLPIASIEGLENDGENTPGE